jgi:dTDP-4-amino-4,6-dideoxygalactose transaminase
MPAFTFVATAHAFHWLGLTPVFCDIDERTHNLDPHHVAELVTDRTSAVVAVHVWGRPAYSREIEELARERELRLIFDAAHTVGCSSGGKPIGGRGDAEILSFHATKILNTFEGGAVLTNDAELAARVRVMRNFGFVDYDNVQYLGINGKLPEMSAAMGLTTLEGLDGFIEINRQNYEQYRAELTGISGLSLLEYDNSQAQNFQYVVLEVDEERCMVPRDVLLAVLHAENILARRYFYPGCHRMEPYRALNPDVRLPATERVASRVLVMPTGCAVTSDDIATICAVLRLAVENAEALPHELSGAPSKQPA